MSRLIDTRPAASVPARQMQVRRSYRSEAAAPRFVRNALKQRDRPAIIMYRLISMFKAIMLQPGGAH